jgi:dephospho-CoA kinase
MLNKTGLTKLGLTGGIGSGKSTVAAALQEAGAAVIDADAISRSTTAAGGSAMPAIAQQFGPQFVGADGALNRNTMRDLVFAKPEARLQLEAIIHPLVGQETARQTQAAIDAGKKLIVFDVPLLVESAHWRDRVDRVLVVDCLEATQIERVMARSQLTREAVQAIIALQASRERRLAAADLVIYNEGLSLEQLRQQAREISHRFGL